MRTRIAAATLYRFLAIFALVSAVAVSPGDGASSARADAANAPLGVLRRLTSDQYKQIILDIFGPSITLGGHFEPDVRDAGLLAVGAGEASVTASGFEQYDAVANGVAAQVVDEKRRGVLLPCRPKNGAEADDACAGLFFSKVGRLLYRRPLTAEELRDQVAAAAAASKRLNGFYPGLALGLAGMLEAPQFLFREERVEPDSDHPGALRLDAYGKASRLSFLLWNSAPDSALLDAAERGELNSRSGLAREVDWLMESPRLAAGVRAFFTDMLEFSAFDTLAKDSQLYPKFNSRFAADAREQTLRTIVEILVNDRGDYRDLFTTRKTFMTPLLASAYKTPLKPADGFPDAWTPYTYPQDAEQAGILTQASFVALHSHPGRSSPTLRGKALREILLCQRVPDPPGNVNFNLVQDTTNPKFKTVRQRLAAHATEATCAGCHKIMDPIGLAMENFDTIGGFRSSENSAPIDPTGELDGMRFTDAIGLGKAMRDDPATPACLINRLYSYGVGRPATKIESYWLNGELKSAFAASGYRLTDLMRQIATSELFYRPAIAEIRAGDPSPSKLASAANTPQGDGK